jgi:probable HAF family extracellular repeat protein
MQKFVFTAMALSLVACADGRDSTMPSDIEPAMTGQPAPWYELDTLDESLGGSVTVGTAIANRGRVAGFADLPDGNRHAVLWREGVITDLGTLGGPNSSVQWPGINNTGMVVGIAQTDQDDPNRASWSCEAFIPATDLSCIGFVWENGVMRPLPTLGGHNGFATMANNRGQVVGWAETPVRDPTCHVESQVLQFRAVLWEPRRGTTRELRPLPGDSTSAATAINDRGQVVGISGRCHVAVGDSSARAAVIWEHGQPREIPTLGADTWNTPMDINNAGRVVGFANAGNDAQGNPRLKAFLWMGRGSSIDLGVLGEDDLSQAFGINARGQVVGRSCGGSGCRAVLWENGVIHDLNDLLDNGGDVLTIARHINDAGLITGNLTDATTGNTIAFVAVPRGRRPQP